MEPPPLPLPPRAQSRAEALEWLLTRQNQVVSRSQLRAIGHTDSAVRTWMRRGWIQIHVGVYGTHAGVLTRVQQEWAACLALWPAALARISALPIASGRSSVSAATPLHVVVASGSASSRLDGVVVHEKLDFQAGARWSVGPPRQRVEVAVLDQLRGVRDVYAHVELVTRACREGWVSTAAVRRELERRARVTHRELVWNLLDDVDRGSHSVLEQEFVTRVVRAHGLPEGRRQVPAISQGALIRRDAVMEDFGIVYELDGWMFHRSGAQREADLARDLAAAVDGLTTIRLGWQQVTRSPCVTARMIAQLLRRRAWDGQATACSATCRVPDLAHR